MRTNILVYKFEGNTSIVRSIGSEYEIRIRRRKSNLKKKETHKISYIIIFYDNIFLPI